jgi:hypothetical protein
MNPTTPVALPTDTLRVVIKSAFFRETGTYNPIFMRPYTTSITDAVANQLIEATRGGELITPSSVSAFSNDIVRPDARYQQPAHIDEGWDTPRFRFLLKVEYHSIHQNFYQGHPPKTKIIQGYTSHMGYTPNGAIDPRMGLRFNTIITLRHTIEQTPAGPTVRTAVAQADHVIHDQLAATQQPTGYEQYPNPALQTPSGQQPWTVWMMRPEDVFRSIGTDVMMQGAYQHDDLFDMRNSLMASPVSRSKRKNSLTPHYVSEILKTHKNASIDYHDAVDYADVMNNAEGHVKENSILGDEFFRQIRQASVAFDQTGSISYGELCSIFPEFNDVSVFSVNSPVQRQTPIHRQGETEFWDTSTNETIWATSLSHAIPAIMLDLMLVDLTFIATNKTTTGEHTLTFLDAHSFIDNLDNLTTYLEHFRWQIVGEVLKGLSMNNQIDYELSVIVNVSGETRITLSLFGGPPVEYATPSFCDALFIPVVTTNQDNLNTLAYDMSVLSGHLQSHQGNPYV